MRSDLAVALADDRGFDARLLRQSASALALADPVLALEDRRHHHQAKQHRAGDGECDVSDGRLIFVAPPLAVEEEPVARDLALLNRILRQHAAVQRLNRQVRAEAWEPSLERLELINAQCHGLVEHDPPCALSASSCREAAIILHELAVHGGAHRPHQVHRLADGHIGARSWQLLRKHLSQELTLLTEVEEEAGHHTIVLLKLQDRLLLLMHHLQLRGILPAVNHVLGGHLQVNRDHLVVLREAVGACNGKVAHLLGAERQAVVNVL
mmetsp:Transcript_116033/g.335079  ORF Transcript_116033/g.335079 Transcript_116033/m.335079 type:complete len:267 (-) Transcript_116033:1868-2668(-)